MLDSYSFVLAQNFFGYLRSLWFQTNFRILSLFFSKYPNEILIGIALSLQIALISVDILTVLIVQIHECENSFHLFMSSHPFISVLLFSLCKTFTSLVKLTPKYFILLDTDFSSLFSLFLFLIIIINYRKAANFYILVLYPTI